MVKVAAPMLSLDASGSIAGAMTFSKWKGRNYVRVLVKPANPRSGGQTGMRAGMKFLSQNWAAILAAQQATWEDAAEAAATSPFNAYTKANLKRWRNFESPSQFTPITAGFTADAMTAQAATAGERQIVVTGTIANVETFNWGVAIYRQITTPVVPAWDNCIAVVLAESNDSFTYVDSPLDPGTYYYNFKTFTVDGVWSATQTEVDDTVT